MIHKRNRNHGSDLSHILHVCGISPGGGGSTTGRSTGSWSVRVVGVLLVAHKFVKATPGRLGRFSTLAAAPSITTTAQPWAS